MTIEQRRQKVEARISGLKYPTRYKTMLKESLLVVEEEEMQQEICEVACVVSDAAWKKWISLRNPDDNRQEHEWVVFANVMKIAEAENFNISERRIAAAFCFLHDTHFIKRIMESKISELEKAGKIAEAEDLKARKKNQRVEHMQGGAKNAEELLPKLVLFSDEEIKICVDIIAKHDAWKVDPPEPPPTKDRLRLACLEGDALWPLHPLGVLADLERPDEKGETKDFSDPAVWHTQLKQSNRTLVEYRTKWKGIPASAFIDKETIFRTREGWRLYQEWRNRWSI